MYFCSALFPLFRIVTTQREGRGVGSTHNGKERDFVIENPLSINFLTLEYLASQTSSFSFTHPSQLGLVLYTRFLFWPLNHHFLLQCFYTLHFLSAKLMS